MKEVEAERIISIDKDIAILKDTCKKLVKECSKILHINKVLIYLKIIIELNIFHPFLTQFIYIHYSKIIVYTLMASQGRLIRDREWRSQIC